jgi:hypothetical protein
MKVTIQSSAPSIRSPYCTWYFYSQELHRNSLHLKSNQSNVHHQHWTFRTRADRWTEVRTQFLTLSGTFKGGGRRLSAFSLPSAWNSSSFVIFNVGAGGGGGLPTSCRPSSISVQILQHQLALYTKVYVHFWLTSPWLLLGGRSFREIILR